MVFLYVFCGKIFVHVYLQTLEKTDSMLKKGAYLFFVPKGDVVFFSPII